MEPLSQYGFHRRLACRGRRRHMQSGGGRTACHKTATERGTKTQWEQGKVQQKETKATELGRGAGPMASVSLRRLHGCRKQCSMPSTAPRSRAAVGPPCVAVRPPTPRKGLRHIARRAAAHLEDLLQVCILPRQLQQHGIVKVLVDGHLRCKRNETKGSSIGAHIVRSKGSPEGALSGWPVPPPQPRQQAVARLYISGRSRHQACPFIACFKHQHSRQHSTKHEAAVMNRSSYSRHQSCPCAAAS